MKISFRPRMGRRRGSEKFSGGVPEEGHCIRLGHKDLMLPIKAYTGGRKSREQVPYVGGDPGW